jgi:hypothetical protein
MRWWPLHARCRPQSGQRRARTTRSAACRSTRACCSPAKTDRASASESPSASARKVLRFKFVTSTTSDSPVSDLTVIWTLICMRVPSHGSKGQQLVTRLDTRWPPVCPSLAETLAEPVPVTHSPHPCFHSRRRCASVLRFLHFPASLSSKLHIRVVCPAPPRAPFSLSGTDPLRYPSPREEFRRAAGSESTGRRR